MRRDIRQLPLCVFGACLFAFLLDTANPGILPAETRQSAKRTALARSGSPSPRGVANAPGKSVSAAVIVGISLANNLLTVDIRDQELRAVVEHIARQDAIDVQHLEGLPHTRISARFTSVSVVEGLKRLLRTADIPGYALITTTQGKHVKVRRILFLPSSESRSGAKQVSGPRRTSPASQTQRTSASLSQRQRRQQAQQNEAKNGKSVFDDIKSNTTARRLLSQLVHPNEQVRDRALERLVRLVGDDEKQAELLEFLEPLMENLASDDQTERNEARAEIRKLLRR